jgi:beta-glucuronidase
MQSAFYKMKLQFQGLIGLWLAGRIISPAMKHIFSFIICALLLSKSGFGQSTALLIQNTLHRDTLSLNSDWHSIVDPHDIGSGSPNSRRYYPNARPASSEGVVEYDYAGSPTLHVPGDWNSQRPELLMYEGTVWYERSFTYHPSSTRRAFLYIGAANYRAHVWMNGQSLCEHEGGFTPFDCEATALLKDGENFVVISVNDARHADDVPALSPDWWNYGGLTRDVTLVEVPQTFIEDYFLQLERGRTGRVAGWVRIAGATAPQKVTVRIPELKISKDVMTDAGGLAPIAFDASGLQAWAPENPKLYDVEIVAGDDRVADEIGFRSIEVRGTDILLNGKPVFLRGIAMHEEAPYLSARAHGDDDARTLLQWAKDLGCNFVRLAHYPYDEHTTRMADRMGLLVWSEIPVYQTINWNSRDVLEKAKHQLAEMINRDKNRAGIILWSVTNESPAIPERNAFVHELVATARSLDPSRLITAATNQFTRPEHKIVLNDPIVSDLDVIGINEYFGWYYGAPGDLDVTTWTVSEDKPLIISEFGGDARQGMHGKPGERWTEEYQEEIYKHQLSALRKLPTLRGMSPWILKDFRSPHRQLPGIQDGYNRKGLISDHGERKKAFYVLQQFYRDTASQRTATGK